MFLSDTLEANTDPVFNRRWRSMNRASPTRTSSNDTTQPHHRPQTHRKTRIRTTRGHTSTTSLDTRDAITPTPLSARPQQAFAWRNIHGCTIISALQDLARRAKRPRRRALPIFVFHPIGLDCSSCRYCSQKLS